MICRYVPDGLSVRPPPLIRSEGNRFYAGIPDRAPVSAAARLLQGEKRYPVARNIQVVWSVAGSFICTRHKTSNLIRSVFIRVLVLEIRILSRTKNEEDDNKILFEAT